MKLSKNKAVFSLDNTRFVYGLFFFIAAVALLLMSKNSFLYAMNDTQDVNCFVTSANLILSGKVPYRDFFEQKGPVVYWVHALVLWLYPKSYHGLYLLEIVCAGVYYIYNYKLLSMFFTENTKKELFVINALSSSAVYFSVGLYSGGEVEEYLLPLFSYLLYNTVKVIINKGDLSIKTCLFIGIHVGVVLWSKYFCLLLYGICFIFLTIQFIKNKYFTAFKRMLLFCTAGFCIVTIPVVIYFYCVDGLKSLIDVYFYTNIFDYDASGVVKVSLIDSLIGVCARYIGEIISYFSICDILFVVTGFYFISEIYAIRDKYMSRDIMMFFNVTLSVLLAGTILIGRKPWLYYLIPVFSLFPFICNVFYNTVKKRKFWKNTLIVTMLCSFVISFLSINAFNRVFETIRNKQSIIQTISDDKGDFIIIDRMDEGYYMGVDYLPDEYYFTLTNARKQQIGKVYEDLIREQKVKYIIFYGCDDSLRYNSRMSVSKEAFKQYVERVDEILLDFQKCGYNEVSRVYVNDPSDQNCVILCKLAD